MNKERVAAIDLGTNTFHLLIAEAQNEPPYLKEIKRIREYVYLGKKGVEKITEESFKFGIETIVKFAQELKDHQVSKFRMTGTEALRIASNGPAFVKEVKRLTGLDIEIIEGQKEAYYVYKGVSTYLRNEDGGPFGKYLIMDIGGGSVEFIHFQDQELIWARSFPIGISVLYNNFQKNDPITPEEISATRSFLKIQLQELHLHLKKQSVDALIGSAGSFEVIESILEGRLNSLMHGKFDKQTYQEIFKEILPLNREERMDYPGIPEERVKLIPIAMVLIDYVLEETGIGEVVISPFALKEGVIGELLYKS